MAVKKRSRKAPVTSSAPSGGPGTASSSSGLPTQPTAGPSASRPTKSKSKSKSSRQTQAIISTYHTLLKRRQQLQSSSNPNDAAATAAIAKLEKEMESLGGLDAYQKASQMGQTKERGGDSGRVLVPWLEELGWGHGSKGVTAASGTHGKAEGDVDAVSRKGKGKASEEEVRMQEARSLEYVAISALTPRKYTRARYLALAES